MAPGSTNTSVSGELAALMDDIVQKLAQAAELAAATTGAECLSGQTDETLLAVTVRAEAAARNLGCVQTSAAAIIQDRSAYETGGDGLSSRYGHRRTTYLLEDLVHISNSEAVRRVRVGSAIRTHLSVTGENLPAEYPVVGSAVRAGVVSVETASRIISGLDEARKHHRAGDPASEEEWQDNVRAAETHLVEASTNESPDLVRVQIRQWRDALDPDGVLAREEEILSRRGFKQGRERNGLTCNTWYTAGEDTAMIKALLGESDRAATPRFQCPDEPVPSHLTGVALAGAAETARLLDDGTDADGDREVGVADHTQVGGPRFRGNATTSAPVDPDAIGVVTAVVDPRTREQRHADTISGYLRAGLRASADETGGARSLVEVHAVVTAADLEAGVGVGWIDGVEEPVSLATIEQLACTNGVRPVLLGQHGEILYLGPKPRLFNRGQRIGMSVRGGGCCEFKGCTKPARQCDAHHVIPWSKGGKTDIDNGILLCPEHHRQIHTSNFTIKMIKGRPFLLAPRWLDPQQIPTALGRPRYRTRRTNRMPQ